MRAPFLERPRPQSIITSVVKLSTPTSCCRPRRRNTCKLDLLPQARQECNLLGSQLLISKHRVLAKARPAASLGLSGARCARPAPEEKTTNVGMPEERDAT